MKLQQALDTFLIDQQIRGNSSKTILYYTQSIGQYISFVGGSTRLLDVDLQGLREYYFYLSQRDLSSVTIQTYIRALRAFLRWCYDEEFISVNWAEKFKLPKAKKMVIDVLTDDEVYRLLDSFNLRYLIHLRDYCICSLMLDSGLRLNEVVTLSIERLHISEGYCIVDGKGNKQRVVPLGLHTRKMLMRYLARRPACALSARLFLMSSLEPITNNTLQLVFKRLKERSSIPRLHAHLLRHTFATRYLENGGDIYALQQILGHTSLEMVKRYVHTTTRKLVPIYTAHSPMDSYIQTKK